MNKGTPTVNWNTEKELLLALLERVDQLTIAIRDRSQVGALLTAKKASEFLGLKEQTLALWRSTGEGPEYVKTGRSVRYKQEAIDRFIENQTVPR